MTLDDAVQEAFREDGLVTGWVLVYEYVGDDDTRGMAFDSSDEMTPWLKDGLLHHALAMEVEDG